MMKLQTGDVVASRVSAQGMVRGRVYEVAAVHERRTFAGVFTTVDLTDEEGGVVRGVGNVHLVLDLRCSADEVERHVDRE